MSSNLTTRIRARFRKYGVARYISHIDLIRVFERSMRRADIPLAYSKGYHPHPKMSFSPALAVGITSDAEYVDVELTEALLPSDFDVRLNAALPDGISVTASRHLLEDEKSITGIIAAGAYDVEVLAEEVITESSIRDGLQKFFAQRELMILRETKKRIVEVDIRPLVYQIAMLELVRDADISLDMLVAIGIRGNVKPEEIISVLCGPEFLGVQLGVKKIHRKELFALVDGKFIPPV